MKKLNIFLFFLSLFILPFSFLPNTSNAEDTIQEKPITVSIFWREECGHCHDALDHLKELKTTYPSLSINGIDINTLDGSLRFEEFTSIMKLPKLTPILQIGRNVIIGANLNKITKSVDECALSDTQCIDLEEFIQQKETALITNDDTSTCDADDIQCKIEEENADDVFDIPFFGEVKTKNLSLPLLSMILGFIDGFNPCAMWVLIMFLTLLLQTGSKKLMWQIAGLFIFAETIMYYLILNVWFTTWNFIGLDKIVTPIVATVAIGAGIYFIYEYITLPPGVCIISSSKQQSKTKNKIEKIIKTPLTWFSAIGIIGIALSVNIIEFACSIGIPQTFTKILEINNLGFVHDQIMMLIYIFFYMLDDFIVFGIALYSFDKIGIAEKYSKQCQLLGGILMIILGLILIFKRSWLVF